MRRGARWLSAAMVLALAFSMLGGAVALGDESPSTSTYSGLRATIQAIVWWDSNGDGRPTDDQGNLLKDELVDGVKVELYRMDAKSGWLLVGSGTTGKGGLEGVDFPAGWVGWDDLELTYPDGWTSTKFRLVADPGMEYIGGNTREFEMNIWNYNFNTGKLSTRFFEAKEGDSRAAFRLKYLKDEAEGPVDPKPEPSDELPASKPEPKPPLKPPINNTGVIQAVIWDDINGDGKFWEPNGQWSVEELIDDVSVNLYRKEGGEWVLHASARSGPGGYFPFGFPHGWVGFKELPVIWDFWSTTEYKLELVTDRTFKVMGETFRLAPLNVSNQWHVRFFSVKPDAADRALMIRSQSVSISGTVWYDANADQVRQWHEPGCSGWTVVITDLLNRTVATATTDQNGYYRVRGLRAGTYKVWVRKVRDWNQVYPYYKLLTIPPWGCEKGHHLVVGKAGNYYVNKDFGMLNMKESVWAPLYYSLWLIGLLQYQLRL